jgi:hypothetical protein
MRSICLGPPEYLRQIASTWNGTHLANNPLANAVGHVTVLLDKLGDQSDRDWCAGTTTKHH